MARSIVVKPRKFVMVEWNDAEDYTKAGWASDEEAKEFGSQPCLVHSYGFIVSSNKTYIGLAADFAPPSTHGRIIKIPKKMIISTKEIPLELNPPVSSEPPTS